jgi:hypothetical protein
MLTEEGRRNYIALKAQAGALDIVLGFINYDVNESTYKEWEMRANVIRGKI